jgi:plastocyanin
MMDDMSATMTQAAMATMTEASSMMDSPPAMQTADATSVSTSAYAMPTYGSGSSNWNSQYNSCVQRAYFAMNSVRCRMLTASAECVAEFGSPSDMPSATAQATATAGSAGGSGATHTVIVAPSQGVLRYVPFAVDASVGDTVRFEWHANVHTVTKSSQLEICNKTGDAPFASGTQNASFVFLQQVNDTNPTFFYCGTPGHCQKGMFGIINPTSAQVASNSAGQMVPQAMNASMSTSAMAAYAQSMAANSSASALASTWGANMDMASIPAEFHDTFAQNMLCVFMISLFSSRVLTARPATRARSSR